MGDKIKLLVVEDDENLGQILTDYLRLKQYDPVLCGDGEEGLEKFRSGVFDLCLLDVMLPKRDGFSLAREIRSIDKNIPIIFLTAKSMKEDAIEGFQAGADDYVNKPFSMEELLLRIKAVLKRTHQGEKEQSFYTFGNFSFDFDQRILKIEKESHKLTTKEAQLLRLLCINVNQTLDRSAALKMIWRDDSYFNARSMDVYIAKLRKYLKADPSAEILTVHGEGFKLIRTVDTI